MLEILVNNLKIRVLKLAYVKIFYYLYLLKRPCIYLFLTLGFMFIPYDIVILLILSPFLLIIWVAVKIVVLIIKLAMRLVKYAVKMTFRLLGVLFCQVRRLF